MSERPPEDERPKYRSLRDQALHTMCLEGWGNATSGEVSSPTGFFSRISNEPDDMLEIRQAFNDIDFEAVNVLGHYLVVERPAEVGVAQYATARGLLAAYLSRDGQYQQWRQEEQS